MGDEHVQFLKGPLVQQQVQPFPGRQAAALVLAVNAFLSTPQFGLFL